MLAHTPGSVLGKLITQTVTLISPSCTFLVCKTGERTHISQWSCEDEQNTRSKLLAESHETQRGNLGGFPPLVADAGGTRVSPARSRRRSMTTRGQERRTSAFWRQVFSHQATCTQKCSSTCENPPGPASIFLIFVLKLRIYLQTTLAISGQNNILA